MCTKRCTFFLRTFLFYLHLCRKHINSTRLRTARLSSLQKLLVQQQADATSLPLIPDGFAKDADESAVMHEGAVPASSGRLNKPRSCYVCKKRYTDLHHFYDQLCPSCALLNFSKRNQVFMQDSSLFYGCSNILLSPHALFINNVRPK